MNESNESKSKRLQNRLDNRSSRKDTRSYMTDFDEKTKELEKRQAGYQDAAQEDKKVRNWDDLSDQVDGLREELKNCKK